MDFSFEKTNSAYMLFYERRLPENLRQRMTGEVNVKGADINDTKLVENLKVDESCNTSFNEAKLSMETEKSSDENDISETKSDKIGDSKEPKASTSAAAAIVTAITSRVDRQTSSTNSRTVPQLNKELEDWIWQDNRQFLQDRNIFEHTYFKCVQ